MNLPAYPIARLLWGAPLLLLLIAALLLRHGLTQRDVAARGTVVEAQVVGLDVRERSEITRGEVVLRYVPPGATAPIERAVELPLSFLKELEWEAARTVSLRLLPGTDQVVLARHARSQWILTLSFAAMALFGALAIGWMVAAWNRLLVREGDPGDRPVLPLAPIGSAHEG